MRKKRKVWPYVLLGVVVLLVAGVLLINAGINNATSQLYTSYTVGTGSVETSITGSGKLSAGSTQDIEIPVGVKIDEVFVELGDAVEKGDTLFTYDVESLKTLLRSLTSEINNLDQQMAMASNGKTVESVTTPVKGRIKCITGEVNEEVSDVIAAHGALAIISADGMMCVEIETNVYLEAGTEVEVYYGDTQKKGKIARSTADGYVITLDDNGVPYGETAEIHYEEMVLGKGTLEINEPLRIFAESGVISRVHYEENASVSAGAKLFTLESGPMSPGYATLYNQRTDLEDRYEETLLLIASPFTVAEEDGIVSAVYIAENTTFVSAGQSSKAAALTFNTGSANKLSINVDELDIASVVLGQKATVLLDGIPSESFSAEVVRIPLISTSMGSAATYAVELRIDADARLLAGMNANATIAVDRVENAVTIPIEAINEDETGIYVYTSASGATDGSDRVRVDIKTGLSDGIMAEVTEGLSAGDIIMYAKSGSMSIMDMMGSFGGGGWDEQ